MGDDPRITTLAGDSKLQPVYSYRLPLLVLSQVGTSQITLSKVHGGTSTERVDTAPSYSSDRGSYGGP